MKLKSASHQSKFNRLKLHSLAHLTPLNDLKSSPDSAAAGKTYRTEEVIHFL